MKILAIETSCDETAASVVEDGPTTGSGLRVISNIVASSLTLHAKTGGIVPKVAAREQAKFIIPVIEQALNNSLQTTDYRLQKNSAVDRRQKAVDYIDSIAVTVGPGLIGSLLIGVETAKTLAYAWNKPIIPVNHLVGHIYANWLTIDYRPQITAVDGRQSTVDFPAVALVVSGGHTDLVLMKRHGNFRWLGGTRDDAAGEAFDKIGRLLGFPYPGGPAIAAEAAKFEARNRAAGIASGDARPKSELKLFPRPMIDTNDFDFSFSGLKTAVIREIKAMKQLNNETINNMAAEVQAAIVDVLVVKTIRAAQRYRVKSMLLGGGVAANEKLREQLKLEIRSAKLAEEIKFFAPPKNLCTDNAAMIGAVAFFNNKPVSWNKVKVDPNLHFC